MTTNESRVTETGNTHVLGVVRLGLGVMLLVQAVFDARELAAGYFGDRFHLPYLPDALVVFYTLNNQSIEGASSVATHVAAARMRRSAAPFPIFSVATRVELAEKERLEASLKELKDALAGPDVDAVTRAREGLTASLQDFSQRLYAAAQQQAAADGTAAGDPGAASAPDDDEVAEAEIVDEPDEQQSA